MNKYRLEELIKQTEELKKSIELKYAMCDKDSENLETLMELTGFMELILDNVKLLKSERV